MMGFVWFCLNAAAASFNIGYLHDHPLNLTLGIANTFVALLVLTGIRE